MEVTKGKFASNLLWRFCERSADNILRLVISIVIARILDPSAYGSIALVTVFITILNVFVDSGFASALIQKKNADQLDYNTVFFFNIFICVFLYLLMFLCAPIIANFYNDESLVPVIRVLSLTIIFSGLSNIQQAYLTKNLIFKKLFFANMIGCIASGITGITLAYTGFGIWALVFQQLVTAAVSTLIMWIIVRWKPQKMFSIKRLKELFGYGCKLLVSGLIDTVYNQMNSLIIGKVYSPTDLAFYNKGRQFPETIVLNINASINSVLFPTLAYMQDNIDRLRNTVRRAIKTSIYFMAPLMMGFLFAADNLVQILLTEKWMPCVFFIRIFCITFMFYPLHTANLCAIKSVGRSDIFLKLEILKKVIGVVAILITVWISVEAMAISCLFTSVTSQIINSYPNKKLINYSYIQQIKDMLPEISLAVFMGCCIFCLNFLGLSIYITLVLQVIIGIAIYWLGSIVFKFSSYAYIKTFILEKLSRKQ